MLELRTGDAVVEVAPERGGRLVRFRVGGMELLVPPEVDDHDFGCFVMAPWVGRVRHGRFRFGGTDHQLPLNMPPHAIHGTARDQPWHVAEATATVAVLDLALGAPWPFGGRVVSRVELTPDALDLRLEVHATDHAMPVACGWHPWWNRHLGVGEALEVELHADVMYRRDAEGIPTGELGEITPPPWDDCFAGLGSPAAVLRWPQALSVTMETDCPCLVVYTQPERAVCVEPESGPPDAFNLDPAVVEPGPPLVVTTTWRWAVDGASR